MVTDKDPNIIPPLSMFTTYIQLPGVPEQINHFESKFRGYTKSERKYPTPILTHVTCIKSAYYIVCGVIFYVTTVFFIYALVTGWSSRSSGGKKKTVGIKLNTD